MNAIASVRSRPTTFVAGFLSMFLGAIVVGSFATLLATGLADGVSSADQETLVTMASVVGGWGLMIVLFSVASTMSVQVRQRAGELARYRMVGALPRQVRRMVLGEALVLGAVAVVLAVLPTVLVGRWVFGMLHDAGMVDPAVEYSAGVPFVAATSLLVLLVSLAAVRLCVHRASRVPAVQALREGDQGERRDTLPWWRRIAATVCLVAGAALSVVTIAVMRDQSDPYAAMQTAGPACIWWSLGAALLAPSLLRVAARLSSAVLQRFGAPGFLAAHDAGRRSQLLAGILAPVIVLVGMGLGTLYLMAIENHAPPVVGGESPRSTPTRWRCSTTWSSGWSPPSQRSWSSTPLRRSSSIGVVSSGSSAWSAPPVARSSRPARSRLRWWPSLVWSSGALPVSAPWSRTAWSSSTGSSRT